MVKMDSKFIKTSNRSSFLSIKLLFSGFQISFPIFLNTLLCKITSYCNCNRHIMFLGQECDILLLNKKLLINFQKCYIKRMKLFYERQDILKQVFCLSKATYINFLFRKKSIFWHALRKYNPLSSLIMKKVSCNIQKYYNYYLLFTCN
jgi:hypothetical protein